LASILLRAKRNCHGRAQGFEARALGRRAVCVQRFSRPQFNVLVIYIKYIVIILYQCDSSEDSNFEELEHYSALRKDAIYTEENHFNSCSLPGSQKKFRP
jgi:hypothetical protein